jgi:hypothetical protein
LVLYAKQDALYNSGIADIISPKLDRRRDILVKLFKVHFVSYALGAVVVLPLGTVATVVVSESATSQGLRVV